MKKLLPLLCIMLLVACARKEATGPQAFFEIEDRGYAALAAKDYEAALKHFRNQQVAAPASPWPDYNMACVYARWGKADQALGQLRKALEKGFVQPDHFAADTDLEAVRRTEGFREVLEEMKARRDVFDGKWASVFGGNPPGGKTYADLKTLQKEYHARWDASQREAALLPQLEAKEAHLTLAAEQMASLRRLDWEGDPAVGGAVLLLHFEQGREGDREEGERLYRAFRERHREGRPVAEVILRHAERARQQDPEAAAAEMQKAVEAAPKSEWAGEALVALAGWADKAGQNDEAYAYYQRASDVITDHRSLRFGLSSLRHVRFRHEGLPPLNRPDLDGKVVRLDEYRGKVLLIDFWATWCGPCRAEIPNLAEAYRKYHADGFEIVGVSLDEKMKPQALKAWCEKEGSTWRQNYDGKGWKGHLAQAYTVYGIPAFVIVDRQGRVHAEQRGPKLVEYIGKLVSAKPEG